MGEIVNVHTFGIQDNVTPSSCSLPCHPGHLLMVTAYRAINEHQKNRKRKSEREMGRNSTFPYWPSLSWPDRAAARLGAAGSVAGLPVLSKQKGWDSALMARLPGFWIASALSGLVFGRLADRYDRRLVMMLSMLFSAPAFFLLPAYEGAFAFFLAIAAGGLSGGAHSLIVVMAQDLIPMRKGFASGAILGFIFATGAVGSLAIGIISEHIGLSLTFQIVAFMIAVAGALSLLLPRQSKP